MTSQFKVRWACSSLLLTALLFVSSGLRAADFPVKAPVIPVYGWSGFYIGANVGYSWGRWSSTSDAPIFPTASTTASPHVDGWLAGLQAGYNWQINRLLLGLEADYQITGEKASNDWTSTFGPISFNDGLLTATTATSNEWKFPWFATFRGRAGYVADDWLLYATGGLALGRASFSTTSTATLTQVGPGAFTLTATTAASESKTKWGWTLGAGVEKALGANFSAKLEYLYLDLGSNTFLTGTGSETAVKLQDHILRVGLNYRFSGPLIARF